MRTRQGSLMVAGALAAALVAGRAEAEPPAPPAAEVAPAAEAPPAAEAAPKVQTPAVKPRPAPAPAPPVKEGFMVIPSIGINSFQGDSGRGTGVGLRVGLLAGSRLAERFSLNLGLAFDKVNVDAPDTNSLVFDLGLAPLIHFPQEKLEIVVGPVLGSFVGHASAGSGTFESSSWTFGWTLGANAGVVVPVGTKVKLGGMLNFTLRNPLKVCTTFMGNDTCGADSLPSAEVLSFAVAAML